MIYLLTLCHTKKKKILYFHREEEIIFVRPMYYLIDDEHDIRISRKERKHPGYDKKSLGLEKKKKSF